MLEVRLFPGLPGGQWARLGPITGAAEQCFEPDDPAGFAVFLDELLVKCEGTTVGPGRALDLAVADHDRIAAQIYCREYADRIESRLRCRQCTKMFDVSFQLEPLASPSGSTENIGVDGPDEGGMFQLKDGPRFRLPTVRDQLATRQLSPKDARQELLRRCVEGPMGSEEVALAAERAMELVAPLLSQTLAVSCPHCDFRQENVSFSVQRYLLDALAFERRFLFPEVHQVARAYGWSRGDILAMPTTDRRVFVRLILGGKGKS
jgi:hypothetical protein